MSGKADSGAKLEAARVKAVAEQAAREAKNAAEVAHAEKTTRVEAPEGRSKSAEPSHPTSSSKSPREPKNSLKRDNVVFGSAKKSNHDTSAADATPVQPVRSAKDAINAMYAQDSDKRLSNYLAKSAKEIINATGKNNDQKSAASIHQNTTNTKYRLGMARPSASGVMRMAPEEPVAEPDDMRGAMDPLLQRSAPTATPHALRAAAPASAAPAMVATSLKLRPKRTPARPVNRPETSSLNGQKGQSALAQLLAQRNQAARPVQDITPVHTARQINVADMAEASAGRPAAPAANLDQHTAETLQAMRQAVQKTKAQVQPQPQATVPHPRRRTARGSMQDVVRPLRRVAPGNQMMLDGLPADSAKRRFRAAPKNYRAQPTVQATSYAGFETLDAETPIEYDDPLVRSKKPPVEIYGLMDEEPTGKRPEVEDYAATESPISGSGRAEKTPDNNRYALQGQSPLFLKSVNVEKRPLSGSIGSPDQHKITSEGTLYERPDTTPVGGKNVYNRQEERKKLPTKPTVIIPASRRSRAPLVFLLILTVVLGAAVGAFIYLCFFQYME